MINLNPLSLLILYLKTRTQKKSKQSNCISNIITKKKMRKEFYVGVFGEETMRDKQFLLKHYSF